jgi:superfamily I DNA/RNA helicase/RecB family exonuclease
VAGPAYRLTARASSTRAPAPALDDGQRAVVEHRDGPLVVLAGPGSGKTATLVEAVVERVDGRGIDPGDVLVLTFGRRAAGEIRDRIAARLGRTVREPVARTFHSYAFGLLRIAAVQRGDPTPRLLSGPEQDMVVRELLAGDADADPLLGDRRWPPEVAAAVPARGFAGELRDLLLRSVERGVDGAALRALGSANTRPDWVRAGDFLQQYQDVTAFQAAGAFDPAELIRAAIGALETPDDDRLRIHPAAAPRIVLVDEYQDTDPAQARLLAIISAGAQELIVVGDPDQSIYSFRGADSTAMSQAAERFGGRGGPAPTVALRTSRRAGPTLLRASRAVAARLPGPRQHRDLSAAPGTAPGEREVRLLRTAHEEADYVAYVLRRAHLQRNVPWSRMAVLVRSTAGSTMPVLRRAMAMAGVPVLTDDADLPLVDQPAVAELLRYFACSLSIGALTPQIAESMLCGAIGRADALQVLRLRRHLARLALAGEDVAGEPVEPGAVADEAADDRPAGAGAEQPQPDLLLELLADPAAVAGLPPHLRRPVQRVLDVLLAGRAAAARIGTAGGGEEVLWAIWQASDLGGRWARLSAAGGPAGLVADRDLDAVVALFAAAARYADRLPQSSAALLLEHVLAQQIPGDTLAAQAQGTQAVRILTAHAAKGLEWDVVCVAGVQEGRWPDLRPRGSLLGSEVLVDVLDGRGEVAGQSLAPQLAEERRLFYVAVTRARSELVVTAVADDEEQPSRFLDEVDPPALDADGAPIPRPVRWVPRGAHLDSLVAELRAAVCDPAAGEPDRAEAAKQLARMAKAGVRGADPADWWGLAPLSHEGPVHPVEKGPVPVSPSRIDSFITCELRTLLQGLGGADAGESIAASLGSLIHEIASLAPESADSDVLEELLDERFAALDIPARWYVSTMHRRARDMLVKLAAWVREQRERTEFVAVERSFAVRIGDDALLAGRVDRLERDDEGRLVILDLKTSGSAGPRGDDLTFHPQLGAYQLAVAEGGFEEGDEPGGAALVQLGNKRTADYQVQPPLADFEDPGWARQLVLDVAERYRGAQFVARENQWCDRCDLARSCPVRPEGRQVTQ